jgi:arsenate reductase
LSVAGCCNGNGMKVPVTTVLLIALAAALPARAQLSQKKQSTQPRQIVFVCEHGAALSVVSAAYFNKLAQEQHLEWHGVARGVTPQEALSASAEAGLKKDGVKSEVVKPTGLSQEEFSRADYVVTFLPIPEQYAIHAPTENWNDVTWGPNAYERARDGILKHMQQLLDTLKAKTH